MSPVPCFICGEKTRNGQWSPEDGYPEVLCHVCLGGAPGHRDIEDIERRIREARDHRALFGYSRRTVESVIGACLEIGKRRYNALCLRVSLSNGKAMVDLDHGPQMGVGTDIATACNDLLERLRKSDSQHILAEPPAPSPPVDPFEVP